MSPTTHPAIPDFIQSLHRVPILVWIIIAAALLLLARYIYLIAQASQTPATDTQPILQRLHAALRQFAHNNAGRTPESLDELDFANADAITYRPIASVLADQKILVAHDATPSRRVLEFPHLRPARNVLFWSGRVRLVSESAFEKLIEADDAFRAR